MLVPFRVGAPSGLHEHLDMNCLSLLAIDGNELDVTTGRVSVSSEPLEISPSRGHLQDESGIWWDKSRVSLLSVGVVTSDSELGSLAQRHARNALLPVRIDYISTSRFEVH